MGLATGRGITIVFSSTSLDPVCVALTSEDSIPSRRLSFLLNDFVRLSRIEQISSESCLQFWMTASTSDVITKKGIHNRSGLYKYTHTTHRGCLTSEAVIVYSACFVSKVTLAVINKPSGYLIKRAHVEK